MNIKKVSVFFPLSLSGRVVDWHFFAGQTVDRGSLVQVFSSASVLHCLISLWSLRTSYSPPDDGDISDGN